MTVPSYIVDGFLEERYEKLVSQTQDAEDFLELDFEAFCERCLVIQNKEGELVPLILNDIQRDLVANLTGRDLVLKARQKGVTTVIQAWQFYKAMHGNARTSTLCHDDDLTQEVRDMVDRFYENLPESSRPDRKYANARITTYPGTDSRARIATVGGHSGKGSAGKRKGRGGTSTHIHGSEVAFWPDAESVMAAAMQAGNPEIILESTPNGMTGWFYERCMEALDGRGVWKLHFYPWFADDEYQMPLEPGEVLEYTEEEQRLVDQHKLTPEQIKWRRYKNDELPHTFKQEYPEDPRSCFLASGNSYFRDVEHVFTAPMGAHPQPGHRYVGGLDFAQTGDYTCLVILDATTYQMVDFLHINQLEWQEMRRRVSVMANKWNAHVIGEENAMGSTNTELLRKGELVPGGGAIQPISLTPFSTTQINKPPLIQGLYHALHEAGMSLQDYSEIRHELRAFISKQTTTGAWQYEAGGGAHDDTVIALALAWHGVNNSMQIENVETKRNPGRRK